MTRRPDPDLLAAVELLLPREPDPPITGENLVRRVSDWFGDQVHVHERRVREAIEHLRAEGVPVVSSSKPPKGYRIATTAASVQACIAEFDRRAKAASVQRARLLGWVRTHRPDVAAQMGLF